MLEQKIQKLPKTSQTVAELPETPGIYIFWGPKNQILYIGKAINLKRRVSSYLGPNLARKTAQMVGEAAFISFVSVESDLEALLLEAKLIRAYQPRYNTAAKDDKHPLYIKITKENYPRVLTARKSDLADAQSAFGPFPSSAKVFSVLKTLRRIFPFATHKLTKKPCIYSQIGLCNPCPSVIEIAPDSKRLEMRQKYLANIQKIRGVLSGRIRSVKEEMSREMNVQSRRENYEEAALLKQKLEALDYITQPVIPVDSFIENPNLLADIRQKELDELAQIIQKNNKKKLSLNRIECYDVAHLGGKNTTASMVTFVKGEPDKTYYRHFKIRQVNGGDDIASMKELAKRRLKHLADWGTPDLIVVDGGKPQVGIFNREFSNEQIMVVGLAKRFETLVFLCASHGMMKFKEYQVPPGPAKNLLQRMRNEAHRFARRLHHKLTLQELLPDKK